MKPLLVGMDNPNSRDPRYALYPDPPQSAGGRLCKILGLSMKDYIRKFDRANLIERGPWDPKLARVEAASNDKFRRAPVLILLGKEVCAAFGWTFVPFGSSAGNKFIGDMRRIVILPHPSGRNHLWNEPGSHERARKLLAEAGVDLTPWKPQTQEEQRQQLIADAIFAEQTEQRPAVCENCHAIVFAAKHCTECGPDPDRSCDCHECNPPEAP